MKAKLLKKLRKEIISNAKIKWYSQWTGYLTTTLRGEEYIGREHSPIGFEFNPEKIGKELEHIALQGYIDIKRNKV